MTPALRLVAAGVAALALLGIVALASRGGLGGGSGGGGGSPSSALLDYGFTIFLVFYVLAIPLAIWGFFVQGREARVRSRVEGRRGPGLLAQLVIFVLIAGLVATFVAQRHAGGERQIVRPPALAGKPPGKPEHAATREPQFRWPVVVVVAALGAAGAALLLLRRGRGELAPVGTLAAELGAALDDAIDDVRAETDPRRAVIKAYARMEAILAAHGLPRRDPETPYEYLARALGALVESGRGVERLTDLYEEARFSRHEIDPRMREEAIDALQTVRDELRTAAAEIAA